jgi:hypothetical protein
MGTDDPDPRQPGKSDYPLQNWLPFGLLQRLKIIPYWSDVTLGSLPSYKVCVA